MINVGFISTRLAGTDGVSLETAKWAAVLRRIGHEVFYCAGELEDGGPPGMLVREMHFRNPENGWISAHAFGTTTPHPELRPRIERLKAAIKASLKTFINDYGIDLVIPENALAIPMQIPLGLAVTETIAETGIPTVAHHHDFYWERERYQTTCIPDILALAFPPKLPSIRHVVINSLAQRDLKARRGIGSVVVPNVFDFTIPPVLGFDKLSHREVEGSPEVDEFNADFRAAFGLGEDDLFFLQPTRVVPRKGIELAIELVSKMQDTRGKLVITHEVGDEGMEYLHELQALAQSAGVDLRYVADRVASRRGIRPDGRKIYSLWDAYPHADFVTYPSLYEGFGNALIETVYFKKPALVNRYPVYVADIVSRGFDFIEIEGQVTDEAVAEVQGILADPERRRAAVERNFRRGEQHFSFKVLEERLRAMLASF